MREFKGVRILETADELLGFIKEDPLDRLLDCRNNRFLTVASMKVLGATSVNQYRKARPNVGDSAWINDCTIAVIAFNKCLYSLKCETPKDIIAICKSAENLTPGRLLSWAGYEGLYVLATHPDAEVGEADWFNADGATS
ncbi:hypothetical protein [Pseudomonas cedrina]|uniref:hypothetical protein n=1 Tax=Pseudomonas cedrina TaxID=651740 RepID=UPI002789E5E6|nr:hypothetical protein [Pseudomonas cedrina]MDQ0655151.1 hypothetical protein [Pseudomonas cedrina]